MATTATPTSRAIAPRPNLNFRSKRFLPPLLDVAGAGTLLNAAHGKLRRDDSLARRMPLRLAFAAALA
ncbi:MAG: hypothetical protein ABIW03_07360 [Sphingomicrobium sp.]